MAGIKETKEVIAAVGVLKNVLVKYLADGFQPADIAGISNRRF